MDHLFLCLGLFARLTRWTQRAYLLTSARSIVMNSKPQPLMLTFRFTFPLLLAIILFPVGHAKLMADDRYLIIHADDAGMSHSVNRATIEGLESGVVTSASIMVPCPWFKEFAQYAKGHPQFDYGIHLTLTSEWDVYRWGPVAPREKVPSLIDSEGYLWDNVDQVRENVVAAEVDIELRAQIERAIAFGVPLSHLDTHMGAVMSRPDLVEVYVQLGLDYNLPILFLSQMDQPTRDAYPALAEKFDTALPQLKSKGLPLLDGLLQFYGGDVLKEREQEYSTALQSLPEGVTQLIIHCGYDDQELRGITSSAVRRDQDRRLFSDKSYREKLQDKGIRLISWREFHQMQAEK